ncbi:hypothetical protein WICPIJ_008937, partial [Wickerhamomyces pijperi]
SDTLAVAAGFFLASSDAIASLIRRTSASDTINPSVANDNVDLEPSKVRKVGSAPAAKRNFTVFKCPLPKASIKSVLSLAYSLTLAPKATIKFITSS